MDPPQLSGRRWGFQLQTVSPLYWGRHHCGSLDLAALSWLNVRISHMLARLTHLKIALTHERLPGSDLERVRQPGLAAVRGTCCTNWLGGLLSAPSHAVECGSLCYDYLARFWTSLSLCLSNISVLVTAAEVIVPRIFTVWVFGSYASQPSFLVISSARYLLFCFTHLRSLTTHSTKQVKYCRRGEYGSRHLLDRGDGWERQSVDAFRGNNRGSRSWPPWHGLQKEGAISGDGAISNIQQTPHSTKSDGLTSAHGHVELKGRCPLGHSKNQPSPKRDRSRPTVSPGRSRENTSL